MSFSFSDLSQVGILKEFVLYAMCYYVVTCGTDKKLTKELKLK
jgi:hypothetical protein